jgi:hypothetical protein
MHKFTDTDGREWKLSIHVSAIKRVKDALDLDLLGVADGKLLQELSEDPMLLANVLFVLCEKQCQDAGISDEQFGEGLGGDVIAEATEALLTELVDFFRPGRREILRRALAKVQATESEALARAAKHMDDPRTDALIAAQLDAMDAEYEKKLAELTISGTPSTAPQESSA